MVRMSKYKITDYSYTKAKKYGVEIFPSQNPNKKIDVYKNNKKEITESIIKTFELLDTWKVKENDETELELHSELWTRLAR